MNIRNRIIEQRLVTPDEVAPNPRNWRTHPQSQRDALRGILGQVGIAAPVIAYYSARAGNRLMLIDGHERMTVGVPFPCAILDVDDAEADTLLATFDPITTMATANNEALDALLRDVTTDSPALTQMLAELAEDAGLYADTPTITQDEIPEPPVDPITKPGDLWILGDHRLLCGDSTKAEDVERLMAGQKAALIAADPPYFGKVDAAWDNDFDGYEAFLGFLDSVFAQWAPVMIERGTAGWWCAPDFAWHIEGLLRKRFAVFNHIVWYKGDDLGTTVSVEEMRRWRPRSERLLLCEMLHSPDALLASFNAKTTHIAARSAYSAIIERMAGWRKQAGISLAEIDKCLGTKGMAGHYFTPSQWALPTPEAWSRLQPLFAARGVDIGEHSAQRCEFDAQRCEFDAQRREFDAQQAKTDVWHMSAPRGQERNGHPTPKPLELMVKIVGAHSRREDLVADPFLGSGTTLIAAEQLGRKCYGMEISPAYCDVIVNRWETLTGKKAVRVPLEG
jgi:site-specific DNA-methyltransferase (adenine-specific)